MLRKKMEVSTDEPREAQSAPDANASGRTPEFGEHPVPPDQSDTSLPVDAEAQAEDDNGQCGAGADTGADTAVSDIIGVLQVDLVEARKRAEEAEKRALFTLAEFQNFRRRRDEEQASQNKYASAELIKALLPIIDNFDRALKAADQTRNFDALVAGVSGTLKQLAAFLEKAGVTPIASVGTEFDPNLHEAIGHSDSGEYPTNTVAEEIQKGYRIHDRVLRPAIVKVAE